MEARVVVSDHFLDIFNTTADEMDGRRVRADSDENGKGFFDDDDEIGNWY